MYSLREIKVAFYRHCRGGGELKFKDTWAEEGNVLISWEGFLEELRGAKYGTQKKDSKAEEEGKEEGKTQG